MIVARRKEREYFSSSPEYGHLASKMGSEYLAKLLSRVRDIKPKISLFILDYFILLMTAPLQHLESVIRARIPSILSLINKTVNELEEELNRIGRPIGVDSGVQADKHNIDNQSRIFHPTLYSSTYFVSLTGSALHYIRDVPRI